MGPQPPSNLPALPIVIWGIQKIPCGKTDLNLNIHRFTFLNPEEETNSMTVMKNTDMGPNVRMSGCGTKESASFLEPLAHWASQPVNHPLLSLPYKDPIYAVQYAGPM